MTKSKVGSVACCKYCGQDVEFQGKHIGWRDRGGNRACVTYYDAKKQQFVKPTTKHSAKV